jgi:hypothetical protein
LAGLTDRDGQRTLSSSAVTAAQPEDDMDSETMTASALDIATRRMRRLARQEAAIAILWALALVINIVSGGPFSSVLIPLYAFALAVYLLMVAVSLRDISRIKRAAAVAQRLAAQQAARAS